jgi:hypothetical protein
MASQGYRFFSSTISKSAELHKQLKPKTDINKLPRQTHHFATNKNEKFTRDMKKIVEPLGLTLEGDWNKAVLPHLGRHPNDYHIFVKKRMEKALDIADGDVNRFLEIFEETVRQPVMQNPMLLRKEGWSK